MKLQYILGTIPAFALLAGCGLDVPSAPLNTEGQAITSDASEADETLTVADSFSSIPALAISTTPMTLASVVTEQAAASKFFQPAGCVTESSSGNVVTYTFNACTGPWGKIKVSGQEIATFSPGSAPGQVDVALQSNDLEADGYPVQHHANVVLTRGETDTTVQWQGGFTGTTFLGRPVNHTSDLTSLHGDDGCTTLNGTTSTTIGTRALTTDYESVKRCGAYGVCPSGDIVATGKLTGMVVTLQFDATTDATATDKSGGEFDFTIACTPPAAGS